MVLVRGLVVLVEALCSLIVAVLERLGTSPVVHRLVAIMVQATAYFMTELLSIESVQHVLAQTITAGMNCFLRQPNMEEHLLQLADTVSRTQPELARKQGRDFPVLVGNFLQGMLSPNRDHHPSKPATSSRQQPQQQATPSTTEMKDETAFSSRGSSPGISPMMPHTLSIPSLQKTWSHEQDHGAEQSSSNKRNYEHGTQSDRSCDANSDSGDVLFSSTTGCRSDVVDEGSFLYRYGPTGLGSGVGSSFTTVEQKKLR